VRVPVCAGNWKMNPTSVPDFEALARALRDALHGVGGVERVVCPPALYLTAARALFAGSGIGVGAQNCHWEDRGAFTGEISPAMLAGIAGYVIIGHSERRTYFGETDETVHRRTAAALRHGLHPITCVGETLAERESGQTEAVLERQVRVALAGLTLPDGFIIAYEPVWAIGTGRAATGALAGEAIAFIRRRVAALAGETKAAGVRILYGGSVTAANIAEFMAQPEIDGALVGGASLKADEFAAIARAMQAARAA
jgi:triosephosphate isomerase